MNRLNAAALMTALLLATTACSGGLLPDGEPHIVGGWVMIEPDGPDEDGRTTEYLTFRRDGTYLLESRFNGFSAGFPPRCQGKYRLEGSTLMARKEVCYDQLTAVYLSEPAWVDAGSVRLHGDYLVLTGDGAESRTFVYRRSETLQSG